MGSPALLLKSLLLTLSLIAIGGCAKIEVDPVAEVAKEEVLQRGKMLVHGLAACGFCHGAASNPSVALVGGRQVFDTYGAVSAANLTQLPDGLASWKASDLQRALRANIRADGSELSRDVHRGYEWMADRDLIAIISYLRTVKPAGEMIERRDVSFLDRNTKGFWQGHREVKGYVPAVNSSFVLDYGKYLVDSVGRCGYCHNLPGGVLTNTEYLAGGAEIRFGEESKIAPGLTSATDVGLGQWSDRDIVKYLRSGVTPSGHVIDPEYCPVAYYATAPESDLLAIAQFLKSL